MNSRREKYLEIKRKNRARLVVVIVASIVIILFSYLVLKPTKEIKITQEEENEAVVTILGQDNVIQNDNIDPLMSESAVMSEEVSFKLKIFQNAVAQAKKSVGSPEVIDKNSIVKEIDEYVVQGASISSQGNDTDDNTIHNSVPLEPKSIESLIEDKPNHQTKAEKERTDFVKSVKQGDLQANTNTKVKQTKKQVQVKTVDTQDKSAVNLNQETPSDITTDIGQLQKSKKNNQSEISDNKNQTMSEHSSSGTNNRSKLPNAEEVVTKSVRLGANKVPVTQSTKKSDKSIPQENTQTKGKIMTVQVASLSDPIQAQALKSQLAGKGYPARVERYKNRDQVLYRVRVGVYNNRDQAIRVLSKLQSLGYSATISR
ncbi:MAG: hypothetical protein GKC53_00170 [Neisseriaceae bacterium]|nr:MAG: hypothetical protein GKC53_00170 [Neisseriaceae bacterium]